MTYEMTEEVEFKGCGSTKKKLNRVDVPLIPDLSENGQAIGKALSQEIFGRIPAASM